MTSKLLQCGIGNGSVDLEAVEKDQGAVEEDSNGTCCWTKLTCRGSLATLDILDPTQAVWTVEQCLDQ
ncbi:Hypothetical protein SMAX5B_021240 [Scophthalmus maximus]|uniref:Uncharacterized protein n=1 Tax=Scophthalmus maximus TaxID=52904 RepID=A0A2U9BSR8_SCOMX|nr:Hypothetical protein SMAX5B_021240 [Scophthalmus maximus]